MRPGPCLDSPRIGWDGLEMEQLPPPVDQAGPRPGPGQRGSGAGTNGVGLTRPVSSQENKGAAGDGSTQASGRGDATSTSSVSTMFRIVRRGRGTSNAGGSSASASDGAGGARGGDTGSGVVYRVATADGIRVRRGADPQSAQVSVLGEGSELVVAEELHDGNGGVWMRLSAPVEGWIGKRSNSLVVLSRASPPRPGTVAGSSGGGRGVAGLVGKEADGNETGEAAEVALAKELEDCMEEEAGTDIYRRDDRLFGSRQGWSLPSGGSSGLGTEVGRRSDSSAESRIPSERRVAVVGHANVSGCWTAMASMLVAAAKEKLAATAATLAVLHCRKILLTVLLQCHKEVMRTAVGGQTVADTLLSQRVAALVGARDSPSMALSGRASGMAGGRASGEAAATLRTRVAARQFSSFLQLVLFRGWRPGWWPLAADRGSDDEYTGVGATVAECGKNGEGARGHDDDDRMYLDDNEPMSECFRSLPVILTPLVSCLIRAAATQRSAVPVLPASDVVTGGAGVLGAVGRSLMVPPRGQSFGAQVEEAILQSVASQLRQATRIGHRDQAWTSSDALEISDANCLRYPRLQYVTWAARVVQAGSGAPTVPRRVFHAWAAGLRSPSLPVKEQVCSELSRLLDEGVQAVDRARRACASEVNAVDPSTAEEATSQRAIATRRLVQCLKLLPLERLRSLAERRMLKEGEDEPMLSRALQSIVDLVASAELAGRVLQECEVEDINAQKQDDAPAARISTGEAEDGDHSKESCGRPVLCLASPSAYVALQGRDLEPPWTAEFWVLRPNADGTWEDEGTSESGPRKNDRGADQLGDLGTERGCPFASDGSTGRASPLPRRGLRKSFSERLPSPAIVPPSIARATSTPSSSVDLSQLPPTDPKEGAPALVRAKSADTVGQDSGGPEEAPTGVVPCNTNNVSQAGTIQRALDPNEFPPLRSAAAEAEAIGARADGNENVPRSSDASWAQGRLPCFSATYVGQDSRGGMEHKAVITPLWDDVRGRATAAAPGGRDVSPSAAGVCASASSSDKKESQSGGDAQKSSDYPTAGTGGERVSRKGVMGTEPAEYLASSQAGHIKIQAGGTVFSPSVGQFSSTQSDREGGNATSGGGPKALLDEHEERPVLSEALCVSMGATGDKEKAFDFVVPTGRWVHLAIVASAPSDSRTTLYVDGVAIDTISLRMSLPMGCLGAGPHAQEVSAASAAGGGSFIGLLAQTRYVSQHQGTLLLIHSKHGP